MLLTNVVCKIFFCNTRKDDGKHTLLIFLLFPFKSVIFARSILLLKKVHQHFVNWGNFFLPCIKYVNFPMSG